MSLAQDLRHAYEGHDNSEFHRLLPKVEALELATKMDRRPVALICSKCGTDRVKQPCPLHGVQCPGAGAVIP